MTIEFRPTSTHWNYFLALESDLAKTSRYVEFAQSNLNTYSIEFAHILFAAASEVDVIAKLLCKRLRPNSACKNIDDYRKTLTEELPDLYDMKANITRYNLSFSPWVNWKEGKNPDWWRSYNDVKHERDKHFKDATLHHVLNAMGALLILTIVHYSYELAAGQNDRLSMKDTTIKLNPGTSLLFLDDNYYTHFSEVYKDAVGKD